MSTSDGDVTRAPLYSFTVHQVDIFIKRWVNARQEIIKTTSVQGPARHVYIYTPRLTKSKLHFKAECKKNFSLKKLSMVFIIKCRHTRTYDSCTSTPNLCVICLEFFIFFPSPIAFFESQFMAAVINTRGIGKRRRQKAKKSKQVFNSFD